MNLLDPRIGASARVIAIGALFSLPAAAVAHDDPVTVRFSNCTEYVGVGPVDHARAAALVPSRFTVRGLYAGPGNASIVVRVSSCQGISVNGDTPRRGTVAHIGINITGPDNDGDINNYTIAYASDHEKLVDELRDAGVNAEYDRNLRFEFVGTSATTGEVYTAVTPEWSPAWSVHGTTGAQLFAMPFTANWWRAGRGYATKMSTAIPSITFHDAANVSFFTSRANIVGNLIGGNKIASFTELPVRGVFNSATMVVTKRP